ncbi:MAG: hypothetical protein M3535_10800, partial [Actinomycetota bacterium]|nr:hypothetical protein [Actinomycetota bacterium]
EITVRNSPRLAATLAAERDLALLFRTLAILRTDCEVGEVDSWRWTGPTPAFAAVCERLEYRSRLLSGEASRVGGATRTRGSPEKPG